MNNNNQHSKINQIEAITLTGDYKKQIRESWDKWDVIGSIVVIALCAAFYIYFW